MGKKIPNIAGLTYAHAHIYKQTHMYCYDMLLKIRNYSSLDLVM